MNLIATFTQQTQYYFLLLWADCDLRGFWKKTSSPLNTIDQRDNATDVLCMARQCYGLADGLASVHGSLQQPTTALESRHIRAGWHGDLKPENILFSIDKHQDERKGVLWISRPLDQ